MRELDPKVAGDHVDVMFRVACAMTDSHQVAEDLVQETYLKVFSRPRFLREDDDLAYLIKALRHAWYDYLRGERTRSEAIGSVSRPSEDLASRGLHDDPHSSLEATELLEALADLPPPYRETVAAVDVAGLSYAEAAQALGVPEGTVMSRLYRGRDRLARRLEAA